MKEAIIRLKKQNKWDNRNCRVAKTTTWYILKKRKCTGRHSPEDPHILFGWLWNLFPGEEQLIDIIVKVYNQEMPSLIWVQRLYDKMQTTGSNEEQKTSLDIDRKHLKKPFQFWSNMLCKDELRLTCTRMMEGEKCGEGRKWSRVHIICQTWWRQCYGMGVYGCQRN